MHRVLILGGMGMLGHMIDRVLSRSTSIQVRRTGRRHLPDYSHFDVAEGISHLEGIIEREGPFHYVVNCIGVLANDIDVRRPDSVCRALRVNSLFPWELAQLSLTRDMRVIHISTDAVFPPDGGTCFEDSPMTGMDIYGRTKALGEACAPGMLIVRCSIIGPAPQTRHGLLEWFRSLPPGAKAEGYTDHRWNGVTTLQFAELCKALISDDQFGKVRAEAGIHHFCPNSDVSKYDLLMMFKARFRPDVEVKSISGCTSPVRRILDTRFHSLKELFGYNQSIEVALDQLDAEGKSLGLIGKDV